jgi:hypothetical protein
MSVQAMLSNLVFLAITSKEMISKYGNVELFIGLPSLDIKKAANDCNVPAGVIA